LALGDDLLLRSNGLVRRQIGTGKVLWRQQLVPNEIALVGGVLVADDGHRVTGLDPASGRRLWRLPLPSESLLVNLEGTPRALSDGRQAWLQMRRPLAGVTGQGKL
ncbi:MAG: hypothetical protein FJX77_14785, partial [Armatimonadetes bacterium]|nr:hypothetical protein [Armatimonadota bacterium]